MNYCDKNKIHAQGSLSIVFFIFLSIKRRIIGIKPWLSTSFGPEEVMRNFILVATVKQTQQLRTSNLEPPTFFVYWGAVVRALTTGSFDVIKSALH